MLSDHAFAVANAAQIVPYLTEPAVIVAVSGGSDSLALLLLTAEARKAAPKCRIVAATIDHALRPESAVEARAVAALCRQLNIEHRTSVWQGPRPQQGIQAAARAARQTLLVDIAAETGAAAILTGHTLDDQAETVLMRSRRGEGIGLAGIARAALVGGKTWFLRPLLGLRRAALREMLAARSLDWIEDPSNENSFFERVRLRAELSRDPALFIRSIAVAENAAGSRVRLASSAAGLIDRFVVLADHVAIRMNAALLDDQDDAAPIHALRLIMATAGGAKYLPDLERSAAVRRGLRAGKANLVLANARISGAAGSCFDFRRDMRGKAGPAERLRSPYAALLSDFDWKAAAAISRMLQEPEPLAIPAT